MLDAKVVRFIIRDLQPLSVVDDPGFTELLHAFDPRYTLPSRRTVRDVLLPNVYSKTKDALKNILSKVK